MLEAALHGDLGAASAGRVRRGTPHSTRSTVSGYSDTGASVSAIPECREATPFAELEIPRQRSQLLTSEPCVLPGHQVDTRRPITSGQDMEVAAARQEGGTSISQSPLAVADEVAGHHVQDASIADALARSHLTGILFSDDEEEA